MDQGFSLEDMVVLQSTIANILSKMHDKECHVTSTKLLRKIEMYVDGCFSFCFYDVIINFLINRTNIWIWRQAFASLQHCFLRSEENVLYNFETPKGVWENVSYNILTFNFIKSLFKADVMPQCYMGRCYAWQMLFGIWDVVDVITTEEDVISSYCF